MVVHRKDTKKQNVRTKKKYFSLHGRSFLHELLILKGASYPLQKKQKKDMKKRKLKIKNYIFYKKVVWT